MLDDGLVARHFLHADGQHNGHDGRQPLGNGRHRQRDRGQEHLGERHPAQQGEHQKQRADDERRVPQQRTDARQPLLQGRFAVFLLVQQRGDAADARVHSRRHRHGLAAAAEDGRA